MALAPWPDDGAPGGAIEKIMRRCGISDYNAAAEIGEMASALVQEHAPNAPVAVKDEAVLRVVAHLWDTGIGSTIVTSETVGPRTSAYVTNLSAAFRNCGAAGLLSPWVQRRAGLIQ